MAFRYCIAGAACVALFRVRAVITLKRLLTYKRKAYRMFFTSLSGIKFGRTNKSMIQALDKWHEEQTKAQYYEKD